MRRLILPLLAALTVSSAVASPTLALAERGGHDHRGGSEGRWEGRRDGGRYEGERRGGHWEGENRWERHGDRDWDDRRFNGYWYNNRWAYGPPPQAYYGNPGYRPGYSSWRRGGYLPPYYNGWVVNDYARYQLRRPPYGYHWVRIGNDYLLVADRTGLIFDVIIGGF